MDKSQQASDKEIVMQILAGDTDAFAEIMQRYEAKLMRYVVYLIHNETMARDVVQETFIKAYMSLKSFNAKYEFSSWLYRIAHNEAMNAVRRERHISHSLDANEAEEATYESTVIQDIDRAILKGHMKSCLEDLDIKYREVLMLQYYENMKYNEIADILHIPPSTAGVWVARGKAMLKKICEQKGVHS